MEWSQPMRGLSRNKIAVIGLGYVGLPLAVEFGKKYTLRCRRQSISTSVRT
jgi:hypothetical protein